MSNPPPQPIRRWLRFSLRTLLLFVLLLASGALLWWNWPVWQPKFIFNEGARVTDAGISPDGKMFFSCVELPEETSARPCEIRVRDSASGKMVRVLRVPAGQTEARFSPAGHYVVSKNPQEQHQRPNSAALVGWEHQIFRADTWEKLAWNGPGEGDISQFDSYFGVTNPAGKVTIFRLPSMTSVPVETTDEFSISPDEKWLAVATPGSLKIYALYNSELIKELTFSEEFDWVSFVSDALLKITLGSRSNPKTRFFSVPGFNMRWELDGRVHQFSPNGMLAMTRGEFGSTEYSIWRVGDARPLWTADLKSMWVFFSSDGERVIKIDPDTGQHFVWEAKTGTPIWTSDNSPRAHAVWLGGVRSGHLVYATDGKRERLLDGATGNLLYELPAWRLPGRTENAWRCAVGSTHSSDFLTFEIAEANGDRKYPIYERNGCGTQLIFWHQRRPLGQFSFMYLWEFWLTMLFACSWLWSLWRDRRIGARA